MRLFFNVFFFALIWELPVDGDASSEFAFYSDSVSQRTYEDSKRGWSSCRDGVRELNAYSLVSFNDLLISCNFLTKHTRNHPPSNFQIEPPCSMATFRCFAGRKNCIIIICIHSILNRFNWIFPTLLKIYYYLIS